MVLSVAEIPEAEEADGLPDTMSVKEFAKYMGVHPDTARWWLRTGKVRGIKLPGNPQQHWRVPKAELIRLGA